MGGGNRYHVPNFLNHPPQRVVGGRGRVYGDGLVERVPGERGRGCGGLIAVGVVGGRRRDATGYHVGV